MNTHLLHTHVCHTHHTYITRPITTLRLEDRVLGEITEIIKDSVGDGHVTIPLWLHAREVTPVNNI
jgi:hypothetical protein